MSPEQATGEPVDKRTDIWAFGVCLYEALAGRRAFEGEDATSTLAAVLRDEVDLEGLPDQTPDPVRRVLLRCLVREARNRQRDIGDTRIELSHAVAGSTLAGESADVVQHISSSGNPGRRLALLGVAVLVGLAGLSGWLYWSLAEKASAIASSSGVAAPIRSSINLPASALLALGTRYPLIGFESQAVALAPDGRHLVYVGQAGEGTQLFLQDLQRFDDPVPIPGTFPLRPF